MAAIEESEYMLLSNITIEGVQGWALKLFPSMFFNITNNEACTAIPSIAFVEGCTFNNTTKEVTPTVSGTFSFKMGLTWFTGTAKASIQKPIRMSEIAQYGGSNSLTGASTSSLINQYSRFKPDKQPPHGMGEWLNYCHSAEGGAKVIAFSCDKGTSVAYGASYQLTAAMQRKDADVYAIKIAIYNQAGGLVSESSTTNFSDKYHFAFKSSVFHNLSPTTTSTVYTAKAYHQDVAGGAWILSGTLTCWLTLEGIPYTITLSSIEVTGAKQATVTLSAKNNTASAMTFDCRLTLTNGTVNTNKALQFTAPANATTAATLVFAFDVALGIEALNYTVEVKPYNESIYKLVDNGTGTVTP